MNDYQEGKATHLNSQIDIDTLADIQDVSIDTSRPRNERIKSFLSQIRNPRLYRCDDVIVHISYADTEVSINDRLKQYLMSRIKLA